jgi:hypothetical protein
MSRLRAGSILLLTVLMTSALLLLAPSLGSTQSIGATGSQASQGGILALRLRSVTNWVGPVGTFRANVLAENLPDGASITFSVQTAVWDRSALNQSIAGNRSAGILKRGTAAAPSENSTVAISIPVTNTWPTPDGGVVLDSPGVYPVVIEAVDAKGSRLASIVTQLIRLPNADSTTPPLAVGLIIEQRQPQSLALDGSPYLDEHAAQQLFDGLRVLTDFPTVPFTNLPAASTMTDAAAVGSPDEGSLLTAIRPTPTHQLLASTYAPIALGSWLDAGLTAELDTQFSVGRSTISAMAGAAPGANTAVLNPTIGPDGLDTLFTHDANSVIVPSDQLVVDPSTTPAPTTGFDVRSASGHRLHALAAETAISARLVDGTNPVASAQNALADLAIMSISNRRPAQGLAVVVSGATSADTLRALLGALSSRDGADAGDAGAALVAPVRIDDLFAVTDVATAYDNSGTLVPILRTVTEEDPSSLGSYPDELRITDRAISGLVATVPETPALTGSAVHRTLASGDRSLSDRDRSTVLASTNFAIQSVTNEIVMTPEQVVTLTSQSGKVPLNIENRLQVPAHVHVSLQSAKLDFPDGAEFDQVLAPGTTTRIDARVTTRASGAFPLDVVVTSPDSVVSVTRARFTVRSTAISGIGLVLSIGAGLFLLIWWIRHHRTARRASRLVGSENAAQREPLSSGPSAEYAPPSDSTMGEQ